MCATEQELFRRSGTEEDYGTLRVLALMNMLPIFKLSWRLRGRRVARRSSSRSVGTHVACDLVLWQQFGSLSKTGLCFLFFGTVYRIRDLAMLILATAT